MSFLTRARLFGRPLARRANKWDTLAKAIPSSRQADMQATVAAFNKRKAKAAAASVDAPIDFEKYVDVLGKAEVDAIRKEYEAFQYTDFEVQKQEELAEVQAALNKTVAAIEEQSAQLSDAAAAASVELKELERTRTDLETSMDDIKRRYPQIEAQLAERLEAEDWDTESKPIDITALRMEAIEKNWDESTLGPLDENTQKEFLEEIEAIEKANQDSPPSTTNIDPEIEEYIKDFGKLVGVDADPEGAAAHIAEDKVTDADRQITDEGALFREIDIAAEKHQLDRAQGLLEIVREKRAAGELEVNQAFRDRVINKAQSRNARNAARAAARGPIISEADMEGKSAEELETLADAEAKKGNMIAATRLMYASRVKSGDVDPEAKGLDSYGGAVNYLMNLSKKVTQSL